MQSHKDERRSDELNGNPSVVSSEMHEHHWRRIYIAVVVYAAALIFVLYIFSRAFS